MVKEADVGDDTRKQHLELLQDVLHKEYLDVLRKEITKGFVYAYQEQAEACSRTTSISRSLRQQDTGEGSQHPEELQPDEAFLKSIEEQIAIIGSAAEGSPGGDRLPLGAVTSRERITYKSYEPLKEAIEKKLTESVRELSRIITTARTRDEEQTSSTTPWSATYSTTATARAASTSC